MKPGSPRAGVGLGLRFWLVLIVLSAVLSGATSAQNIPLHIELRATSSHATVSNVVIRRAGASTPGQSTADHTEERHYFASVTR